MKTIYLSIIIIIIIFSCKNSKDDNQISLSTIDLITKSENKEIVNEELNQDYDLYQMIGKNYNSPEIKEYVNNLGEYKIEKFSSEREDYYFKEKGIQFSIHTTDSIIRVIFLYNTIKWSNGKYDSYSGKIPFGVSFSDSLKKLNSKFGEVSVLDNQGFYGRTYQWIIQDSLKMSMEVELPRNENEKMFIEFISLSKKWKE